jgi:hypothetical protein
MGGRLHPLGAWNNYLVHSFDARRIVAGDVPSAAIGIPLGAIRFFSP